MNSFRKGFPCSLLLGAVLALCACAELPLQPVHNEVHFTGDYVEVQKCDARPRPIHQAPPRYPVELRRANVSRGVATVHFIVEQDGSTSEVQVESATNLPFGNAAKEAVQSWRFAPGLIDGLPVRVACKMDLHFRLN